MNYQELVSAMQDYLQAQDEDVFARNVLGMIRSAENAIYRLVRTPDCRATFSGTFNSNTFATPADFLQPMSFVVTLAGVPTPLLLKEPSFIYEAYPTGTGNPRFYSILRATDSQTVTIMVGPAPSGTFEYALDYFRTPPSVTTSDVTWISEHYPAVLLYRCLIEGYTFLKGDPQMAKQYQDLFDVEIEKLKGHQEILLKTDSFRTAWSQA